MRNLVSDFLSFGIRTKWCWVSLHHASTSTNTSTAGRPVNFHQLYYTIFTHTRAHILSFFGSSSFLFFLIYCYVGKSACINGCRRHHNMRSVSCSILRIFPLCNVIMSKFLVLLLLQLFVLVGFVFVLSCWAMDEPSIYWKRCAECQSSANIKINEANGKKKAKSSIWSTRMAMEIDMLGEREERVSLIEWSD